MKLNTTDNRELFRKLCIVKGLKYFDKACTSSKTSDINHAEKYGEIANAFKIIANSIRQNPDSINFDKLREDFGDYEEIVSFLDEVEKRNPIFLCSQAQDILRILKKSRNIPEDPNNPVEIKYNGTPLRMHDYNKESIDNNIDKFKETKKTYRCKYIGRAVLTALAAAALIIPLKSTTITELGNEPTTSYNVSVDENNQYFEMLESYNELIQSEDTDSKKADLRIDALKILKQAFAMLYNTQENKTKKISANDIIFHYSYDKNDFSIVGSYHFEDRSTGNSLDIPESLDSLMKDMITEFSLTDRLDDPEDSAKHFYDAAKDFGNVISPKTTDGASIGGNGETLQDDDLTVG